MRRRKTLLVSLMIGVPIAIVLLAVLAYFGLPRPEYAPYQYGSDDREKLPRMTLLNHQHIMRNVLGENNLPVERIGILVYEGASTMEAVGAMAVLSELMLVDVMYVGPETGVISTDLVDLVVEHTIDEVEQFDVLVVPGGNADGLQNALEDDKLLAWIRQVDTDTTFTAGVGYGSLLMAEAGLLNDIQIAFSWPAAQENTLTIGSHFTDVRYTQDGKYWTSVGGTATLDMALAMIETIAGETHVQRAMLNLEYDPAPPFIGGTPVTTSPAVLDTLLSASYQVEALTLLEAVPQLSDASTPTGDALQVGILVYDGYFTLDAIGPLAVLSQLTNAEVHLIRAGDNEAVRSGGTTIMVPRSISDTDDLDVLVVPGGSIGTWEMVRNDEVLDWIRRVDTNSQYTSSVCTGSWILGAAGLLEGRRVTTNWYRASQLTALFDAEFEPMRYTSDGKYWTSAGVSAGIDMNFALIEEIDGRATAEAAMMRLHYHPEPPIAGGTPTTTPDLILDMMHQLYDYQMVPLVRGYTNE